MSAKKAGKKAGKRRTTPTINIGPALLASAYVSAMLRPVSRCACYTEGYEAGRARGKGDAVAVIREALDLDDEN